MTSIFDVEHEYHCNDCNYFSGDTHAKHDSLDAFLEEEGDADIDYNLVFRWDIVAAYDIETDDYHPTNRELFVYFMGQRKGLFRVASCPVEREDEPRIRAYLLPRMRHLFKLWEPLTDETKGDG